MNGINQPALVIMSLFGGALLAAPLAALFLWLFRRSLSRGMAAGTPEKSDPGTYDTAKNAALPNSLVKPLKIQLLDPSTCAVLHAEDDSYLRLCAQSLRRIILAYSLAGLAYALLFGIGWALQFPEGLRAWRRILCLAVYYWWPTVLAIELIAATRRVERMMLALGYFAVLAAVSAYQLAISPKLTVQQLVVLWVITNGPATLLMLAFLRRRVRAVGPLILAFLAAGVVGGLIAPPLLLRNDRWMHTAILVGGAIGLGGIGTFRGVVISGFLIFAILSGYLLRSFAELYRKKKLSDQSLTLDSLFLVFAVEQSIGLDPSGAYMYAGLAAFVAYKAIVTLSLRYLLAKRTNTTPAPILLHLRVFSLGNRSEDLFDGLTKLWRRIGSIVMIAGPDLIRTTVEPHEFLEFIGGKMSRRFVHDETDLNERIVVLDRRPDPDGRYRINQFFCQRNIWQTTMSTLARQSSAVLMDLRSFSQRNQGCLFELAQLVNSIDLRHVVFVIDSTTDREFLEQTLQSLWTRVPAESPNFRTPEPTVRLFVEKPGRDHRFGLLFRELLSRPMTARASAA